MVNNLSSLLKTSFILSALFILNFVPLFAQELSFAKKAGSDSVDSTLDQGYSIVSDDLGNSYITGIMSSGSTGSIFGEGEINETILTVNGAFIAKYDAFGNLLWAQQIEANNSGVASNVITLDTNNNILIAGFFGSEITFGVGTAAQTTYAAPAGNRDAFFAKYDEDGNFQWAKVFGGENDDAPGGAGLKTDSSNNIYLTGAVNGNVTFGEGEVNETTLLTQSLDIFLAKYDSNGSLQWVVKAGGENPDGAKNLDIDDAGNIYITGNFFYTCTFAESLPEETFLSGVNESAFIAKYNLNGVLQWAKSPFLQTGPDISGDIKVVGSDRLVYTGAYAWDSDLTECVSVEAFSDDEIITILFDLSGNYVWHSTIKSIGGDRGVAVAVDNIENIYVAGYYGGEVIIDQGKCNETFLPHDGAGDLFIATYDNKGQFLGAARAGSNDWEQAAAIDVRNVGEVYVTGYFRNTLILGDGEPNATILLENGPNEIFMAKYSFDMGSTSGRRYAGEDNCISVCESGAPFNLFDSLLYNPDTGGSWSPNLTNNGDTFDPGSDMPGVYTYSVYDTDGCLSDSSAVTVEFNGEQGLTLNDVDIQICASGSSFDLRTVFSENITDYEGEWSPNLISGTNIFDPQIDIEGTYSFTSTNGPCGLINGDVLVSILPGVNSGDNGYIELCQNNDSFNLFDAMTGNPDINGIWSPSLSSGTNIFDPDQDIAGSYEYIVSNGQCTSSSIIEVEFIAVPNAGMNTTLEICNTSPPIDLLSLIDGNPDIGGQWNPNLNSGTSIYNPTEDTFQQYTYTVSSAICDVETSATITITNIDAIPITDYQIEVNEFSSNNSATIIIDSPAMFEYSLDGIEFQSNETFDSLLGGDYNLFVREINGCGFLETTFSVLDYPRFFTPNSDNINDFWQLNGSTNREFTLYIFDRYGQLIKTINGIDDSWDGTNSRGLRVMSTDYWFKVVFEDGSIKTGHFSLLY